VIRIRESAEPHVDYEIAIVKSSTHLRDAYAYVTKLLRAPAQRAFVRFGFGRRPSP
jgi:ABC-type molybdate transport system substrate-binding protein